jgi:hypothetical protein
VVLIHGLLVIPDSRRFLSVEVTRWIGRCTIGELEIIGWIEISCQVVRRQLPGTPLQLKISLFVPINFEWRRGYLGCFLWFSFFGFCLSFLTIEK